MKNRLLLLLLLALFPYTYTLGQGQTPSPSPSPQKSTGEDVLRVETNLVQLDVVVVDKTGKQVTDLRPEDFEVVEDKNKQQVTSFSYVVLGPEVTISQSAPASSPIRSNAPVVPAPLKPGQVHRTIALVVDDLGLSFESIVSVKEALRKFVNEQMQPNDLVAVLRTSRGIGSLQQFTADKQQLLAAIDNVSWFSSGRGGLGPNAQVDTQSGEEFTQGAQIVGEMEEARAANYSVGTLQTIMRILQGLRDLPGRKAVMLYSESFRLFTSQGRNAQLVDSLKKLTDLANQASTVIYTIDASGLNPLDLSASDRVQGSTYTFDPTVAFGTSATPRTRNRSPTQRVDTPNSLSGQAESDSATAFRKLEGLMQTRENQAQESKTVLSLLAEDTGGSFTQNTNNLSLGTQRMMENESGYYLIGYRPEDVAIDPATGRRRLHDINVKVKRSGLRIRSRNGFYGVNMAAATKVAPRTRDQQLAAALTTPFAASGIGLSMTPIFGNDPTAGSYLRVLLHVNTQDLTFSNQPDGSHQAVMDVVAVTFGNDERVIEQLSDTQTINVKEDAYQEMLKNGLVFILNVPTRKAGPVQLRAAVRDAASERLGSASQFMQVPDLSGNRLALSGLYVSGSRQTAAANPATGADEDPEAGPAVRRLQQGMLLNYSYTIYNAQLDGAGQPQLQTQMKLFREGKESFTGKLQSFNVGRQTDLKRLDAGGRLLVGANLEPGEYVLQVTVTDSLAKSKRLTTTTQWIGFEIVR